MENCYASLSSVFLSYSQKQFCRMNQQQLHLVRSSWQRVASLDAIGVGDLFYTRLFQINPDLKPMFRSPLPEQSRKLMAMLGFVVRKLDKLEDLLAEVHVLALRHVRYGVQEADYADVGAALLWTLERGLGESWTPELEEAWTTCYGVLSAAMIDASAEAMYA